MKSTFAKILGWGQLILVAVGQSIDANGVPHTPKQWLMILASAAAAWAIHHASSTDGSK